MANATQMEQCRCWRGWGTTTIPINNRWGKDWYNHCGKLMTSLNSITYLSYDSATPHLQKWVYACSEINIQECSWRNHPTALQQKNGHVNSIYSHNYSWATKRNRMQIHLAIRINLYYWGKQSDTRGYILYDLFIWSQGKVRLLYGARGQSRRYLEVLVDVNWRRSMREHGGGGGGQEGQEMFWVLTKLPGFSDMWKSNILHL